jgi:hypothetical protein
MAFFLQAGPTNPAQGSSPTHLLIVFCHQAVITKKKLAKVQ